MYLGLSIGIASGQIDFLNFYYEEFTLFNYITVSTSLLRIFLLIIAIAPRNKIKTLIVKNKKGSIISVVAFTILFDILEKNIAMFNALHQKEFFIMYNVFLMIVYIIKYFYARYKGNVRCLCC